MIETNRLILRPFRQGDEQDVYEYLSEPLARCFASMKLYSYEETEKAVDDRAKDTQHYFAIVEKTSGKVIGEISVHPEASQPDVPNARIDTYSPCWMLNKDYHGMGYAYEAARAVFKYLFQQMGARRIYAYTEDYNLSSQRLCERLGMRREGFFMEFVTFVNNEEGAPVYENTYQYAILKKEWEAGKC